MYKNVISVDIRVNGEKLDKVGSFKYLGAVATVKSGFQAWSTVQNLTKALARLKIIWSDKHISLSSKIRLMRLLVVSVLLYAYETWTIRSDTQKKLPATEIWRFRKLLDIWYLDISYQITNDAVRDRIRRAIGPYDDILYNHGKETQVEVVGACIKISRACQDNFTRNSAVQGGRRRGRQKKRWENNLWLGRAEVSRTKNKVKWMETVARFMALQQSWLRERYRWRNYFFH